MITTKVQLPDDEPGDLTYRMTTSLHASMARLGRSHIDLFLLHSQLRSPRSFGSVTMA
jgi:aryl-alcohol dehydrogenase-like predicted oxidoreductase